MPSEKRKIGDIGEKIAGKWLEDRGFRIIERNYLKKWGEIDIVSKKGNSLRFIEVKSVSCENFNNVEQGTDDYRPEENVHPKKLERLFKTIETYISEKNEALNPKGSGEEIEWQLDVVVVYMDIERKLAKVKILENIVG